MHDAGDPRGGAGQAADSPTTPDSLPLHAPLAQHSPRKAKISKKKRSRNSRDSPPTGRSNFPWRATLPTDTGEHFHHTHTQAPGVHHSVGRCDHGSVSPLTCQNLNPNPRLVCLDQLGLSPNASKDAGGISVCIRESSPASSVRQCLHVSPVAQQRSVVLRKMNSLCDPEGDFAPPVRIPTKPPVSPYIAAYRQKVYRIRPEPEYDQEPAISLPTQSMDGTCRCRTSSCLKLYCECFKSLKACSRECSCLCCNNRPENEPQRVQAMRKVLDSKYGKSRFHSVAVAEALSEPAEATVGSNSMAVFRLEEVACQCRKSGCSNKYCGCHSRGRRCGDECTCVSCQNK